MKVVRVSAIFLTLMVIGVQQGTPLLSDIWDVIKFGYSVSSKLLEGGFAYDLLTDDTGKKLDSIYTAVKGIMKEQHESANRMEANVQIMLNNLGKDIKTDVEFNSLKNRLTHDYIGRVNTACKLLYEASDRNFSDATIYEIAKQVTSYGPNEIHDNLGHIAQLIIPGQSSYFSNFIDILLTHTELESVNRCGKGSSLQQQVYHLYELLSSTEELAFTTLSYAYTIREKHMNVNYTNEVNGARSNMINRTRQYMTIMKKAMAKVPTEIHACEPSEYIRNENYIELERLNQLVILPEAETSSTLGCAGKCDWFNASQTPSLSTTIGGRDRIFGANCRKCESAGHTLICYPKDINHPHRYLGVETNLEKYGANSIFGSINECRKGKGRNSSMSVYDSNINSINSKCDICVCSCINHEIDRKWRHSLSLKAELSDISKNMVVTGIRFHKTNSSISGQVIYPQIKVGKLLPGGKISDAVWQEPQINPHYVPMVNGGNDYVVFGREADEVNMVNLDDSYVRANHVVTGVQFILKEDIHRVKRPWYLVDNYFDDGKSVGLYVKMTRCNFTSAQLFSGSRSYVSPDYDIALTSYNPWRSELWLENLDVPIKSTKIKPINENRAYCRFSRSDIVKDFGQSTVPFFDIQPVETSPPAPLSGVGLFLKNEKDFGGFLALRIMTLNMTNVINDGVPVPEIDIDDPYSEVMLLPAEAISSNP